MGGPTDHELLIIIPALNEEKALPAVLAELRAEVPEADVLVVDDGSTDGTAEVARRAGALVLHLAYNLGVGGAMRAGYRFALREGYASAVQVDADGQHDPAQVHELVAPLTAGEADVVIGARFAGRGSYAVRGPRRWAMSVLSGVLSRIAGTRLTDTTSGFRAANRAAIRQFAADYPAEYLGDTVEALVIACRSGLVVRQVPVAMRPRQAGEPSHDPWRAAVFLGRAVLAVLVAVSRPIARTRSGR
jgi:glycosyltransferase involved in cell wall biosynthesis